MVTEAYKNKPQPQKPQLKKDDLNKILSLAQIENSGGYDYKEPRPLIEKALEYWKEKDRPTVMKNIEGIFPF